MEHLLQMLCTLTHKGGLTGEDSYGHPEYSDVDSTDVKCFLLPVDEKLVVDKLGRDIVADAKLFLMQAVTVEEGYIVSDVVNSGDGSAVTDRTYEVIRLRGAMRPDGTHHWECLLKGL